MSKLRAMVVDDEPLARDELAFLLAQLEVEVVAQAASAKEALVEVDKTLFDVVFVDLRMPGPDGIALAEALRSRSEEIAIVVVSAHDEALRAFEANVSDYLLKPVRLARLKATIEKVTRPRAHTRLERVAVKRRGEFVVLDIEDVIYFHVQEEVVWAETKEDRFPLDMSLSKLEESLSSELFFRSHRSCLVRIDAIRALEPSGTGTYAITLEHPDAPKVPLSRDRVRHLRKHIAFA